MNPVAANVTYRKHKVHKFCFHSFTLICMASTGNKEYEAGYRFVGFGVRLLYIYRGVYMSTMTDKG